MKLPWTGNLAILQVPNNQTGTEVHPKGGATNEDPLPSNNISVEVEKQPTSLVGPRRDGKDAKAPGEFPLGEVAVDGAGRITPLPYQGFSDSDPIQGRRSGLSDLSAHCIADSRADKVPLRRVPAK